VAGVAEVYFGGEETSGVHHQSFTCPYCGQFGLTNIDLLNHIDEEHPDNTQEVVCAGLLSTRCGKNEYHREFLGQYFPSDWWCPHLPTCRSQTAQLMKTGKYSFERGIIALHFGENYASLPLPISEKVWQTRTSFISEHRCRCRFTIAHQVALLLSEFTRPIENVGIAAI